jgi:myosin heavy subunit
MLRIVSAVLNLGNIMFDGETDVKISNLDQLEVVASLLEVDSEALNSALVCWHYCLFIHFFSGLFSFFVDVFLFI